MYYPLKIHTAGNKTVKTLPSQCIHSHWVNRKQIETTEYNANQCKCHREGKLDQRMDRWKAKVCFQNVIKEKHQKAYESILQFKIKIHIVGSEKVFLPKLCLQQIDT